MRPLFCFCFCLLFTQVLLAQEEREELLDELSQETCECMGDRELTMDNMEMVIGMCVLQASSDKTDQIESLLGFEMFDQADMYSLGEQVGMRMMMNCEPFQNLMMDAAENGGLEDYLEQQGIFPIETPDATEMSEGDEEWMDVDRPEVEEPFGGDEIDEVWEETIIEEGDISNNEVFPPTEEEWVDIDRPEVEEDFGNGGDGMIEEPFVEEVFPPTEEEWMEVDRPETEEDYGNGYDGISEESYEEEVFPPTEEEWVDIDSPETEEDFGNGTNEGIDAIEEEPVREFITGPMPNTNRTAVTYPTITGQVRRINAGMVSEIVIRDENRDEHTLYLSSDIPGAEMLRRRANVTVSYREVERFDAAQGTNRRVWEIVRVEQ
ncbi:MAG: hypothetical protein AAGF87_09650 [Bacteroidota bacterium]